MKKPPASYAISNAMAQFLAALPTPLPLPLTAFHPVQCPIAQAEVRIRELITEDYSILGLLILRLLDAGITDPKVIAQLSGMSIQTVETYIDKEIYVLEHVAEDRKQLTQLGLDTLAENAVTDPHAPPPPAKSRQYFESVQLFQIDAVTGTIVPPYLEAQPDNTSAQADITPNPLYGDSLPLLPHISTDSAFYSHLGTMLIDEVNADLEVYRGADCLSAGSLIARLQEDGLEVLNVFYRWVYLAKFEGMHFPMLVFSGKRTADKVRNLKADNQIHTLPLSLSKTDAAYLKQHGICFPEVLIREDFWFSHLETVTRTMQLSLPKNSTVR